MLEIDLAAGRRNRSLGDRVQLQQVILNLVMNGIEAMGETPQPAATAARQSRGATSRGACWSALQTREEVWTRRRANSMFEAFYTTKPEGIGLGLSICRSIVEAHGGRLWALANQPHGSIFWFSLPT